MIIFIFDFLGFAPCVFWDLDCKIYIHVGFFAHPEVKNKPHFFLAIFIRYLFYLHRRSFFLPEYLFFIVSNDISQTRLLFFLRKGFGEFLPTDIRSTKSLLQAQFLLFSFKYFLILIFALISFWFSSFLNSIDISPLFSNFISNCHPWLFVYPHFWNDSLNVIQNSPKSLNLHPISFIYHQCMLRPHRS